ncbi:MAG: Rid family hydrolase [bacterium]|nr:Rid family hydrolase [bacterium]
MPKKVEHLHWPDAPDVWLPYAPLIKVTGGNTVYLAGMTAAPLYHSHPHIPAEFDAMPMDMEGQAREIIEKRQKSLNCVGATLADVVSVTRYLTDMRMQDDLNKVWGEFFGKTKPGTTTVQVVRLATDPRCLLELTAVAVID